MIDLEVDLRDQRDLQLSLSVLLLLDMHTDLLIKVSISFSTSNFIKIISVISANSISNLKKNKFRHLDREEVDLRLLPRVPVPVRVPVRVLLCRREVMPGSRSSSRARTR